MIKDYPNLKRRPFLMPIWLAAIAGAAVVGFSTWLWNTADSTTVIVVRDAESAPGATADRPLNAAGRARALRLAEMFGGGAPMGRLTAIYVEPTARSGLTAAPLAQRLGMAAVSDAGENPRTLAHRVLADHSGGRILVVSDDARLPRLLAALRGGGRQPPIGPPDHAAIYIVGVPRIGRPNLLSLRY
ncbi:MAG TPA: hypothetical protein VMV25_00105 [Steroidobacteraceae bacterium]|nr:hypothetical protein [Steroidobacteraceae bacterium]